MQIKLEKLTLTNFKGVRNKSFALHNHNFIFGNNGAGKTTVFDAFMWLLFGKDSEGRSDFNIKTLDKNNNVIDRIDHEVVGLFDIDGKKIEFKRVLKDKWVNKRGSELEVFEGNVTTYFVDDVPLKKSEYEKRISDLINENLFKLIASPTAFNALHWSKQRELLISMAGGIDEGAIIMGLDMTSDQKQWLINMLASESTLAQHKTAINSRIKKQRDEMKLIAPRIDEVERGKPDFKSWEVELLNSDKKDIEEQIKTIQNQIENSSKLVQTSIDKVTDKKQEAYKVQQTIDGIVSDLRKQAVEQCSNDEGDRLDAEIKSCQSEIKSIYDDVKSIEFKRDNLVNQRETYSKQWDEVSKSEFIVNENECICPTCKQELADKDTKIEQLRANFNRDKAEKLEEINAEGARTKQRVEELTNELIALADKEKIASEKLKELTTQKENLKPAKSVNEVLEELKDSSVEYCKANDKLLDLKAEIKTLEAAIQKPDTTTQKTELDSLNIKIEEIKTELRKEQQIKDADVRIQQLKDQEKAMAQEIAKSEREVFLIERYTKTSIEAIEAKINAMFDLVNFKMFESQINGGESETCVCLLSGVPYSDLNHASKINAGIDIINTLSNHYGVNAPIFVDGRESIVKLIDTNSQVINLVVSEEDQELRIVGN